MNYEVPTFDPFRNPGAGLYHPSNDAAQRLMRIQYAYQDIAALSTIAGRCQDEFERRLLLKYVVTEWVSLDKELCTFVQCVMKGAIDYPLSTAERASILDAYVGYRAARRQHHRHLKFIRDKIGAHRAPMDAFEISVIWDSLAPSEIRAVLKPVPALFDVLKGLAVYRWTLQQTTDQGEVIAFIQPFRQGGLRGEGT